MNERLSIKDWHEEERPREKLLREGEHRLSDAELLAILLNTGARGRSCLDLARILLARFGGFRGVARADASALRAVGGIGPQKFCLLRACAEIGRRACGEERKDDGKPVGSPEDVARLLSPRMRDLKREVFKILALDSQNRVLRIIEIEEGTVNYASPILREVFQKALENYASSIVCAHNHPSGNPSPSAEDKKFTDALVAAGKVLQVAVLDHIIIGNPGFFSFADEGLMEQGK